MMKLKMFLLAIVCLCFLSACNGEDGNTVLSSNGETESEAVSQLQDVSTEESETSETLESWTKTETDEDSETVTEYSNYGNDWVRTVIEYNDGVIESKQEFVVVEREIVKKSELFYDENGDFAKSNIHTTNPDGTKTTEYRTIDREANVDVVRTMYTDKNTEEITTSLTDNSLISKAEIYNQVNYGVECEVTETVFYENETIKYKMTEYFGHNDEEECSLRVYKFFTADDVLFNEVYEKYTIELSQDTLFNNIIQAYQILYKEDGGYYRLLREGTNVFFYECIDNQNEILFFERIFESDMQTVVKQAVNGDYCTVQEAQQKIDEMIELEKQRDELIG